MVFIVYDNYQFKELLLSWERYQPSYLDDELFLTVRDYFSLSEQIKISLDTTDDAIYRCLKFEDLINPNNQLKIRYTYKKYSAFGAKLTKILDCLNESFLFTHNDIE